MRLKTKQNVRATREIKFLTRNVEIDQITNFHEKIIWQSLLYRIPLSPLV
jgi:hypothetical protein